MTRPRRIDPLASTAAAWGLDTDLTPPTAPLDDRAWPRLLQRAVTERIVGTLSAAVESGDWAATDAQAEEVAERHRAWMGTAVVLERELLAVGRDLDEAAIPFLVLKGTAIAHLAEVDPSHRCFGDVDLLVQGDHIDRVRQVLEARGGRRRYAEPRPGFDREFTKGLAIVQANALEIDLHRTLTAGPFGLALDLDDLWAEPTPFVVGGRTLRGLGDRQRFVHACIHAVLGSRQPRLLALRDVARTAPRDRGAFAAMLDTADRWRCRAVVALAVRSAAGRLGWRPDRDLAAWSASYVDDGRERRWLATYRGDGRAYASQAVVAVEAVPGLLAKGRYLAAVALPAGATHGDARRARWTRGRAAIRTTLSRRASNDRDL